MTIRHSKLPVIISLFLEIRPFGRHWLPSVDLLFLLRWTTDEIGINS